MVQVKVSEGILEGEVVKNEFGGSFCSFKGIPYAQPPLGDLRFKAPQPPNPWNGVRDAKEHGSICYQHDAILKTPPIGSEDCLYLNVYTPDIKPSKPLPVMFFIHGGGFSSGNGDHMLYGPEFLIRQGVILVTFNYRLEVLGFLCLHTEDIPGNAGMKDQVAALRWVKKNISNFGGDPENITIFGESAGGASVSYHLVSPMTKGLFKRAIMQSGSANAWWSQAFRPRERAQALARKLGLDSDDDKELYEFFKNQPKENLVNASVPIMLSEMNVEYFELNYTIVSEKKFGDNERFFYGNISDALQNGIHEGVEVMAGYCADEGNLLLIFDVDKLMKQTKNFIENLVPKTIRMNCTGDQIFEVGHKMRDFYFGNKEVSKDNWESMTRFTSYDMFILPIIQWQKFCARYNNKNKLYLYKFTCQSERNVFGKLFSGNQDLKIEAPYVSHADDLPYIFPTKFLGLQVDQKSDTFRMINNVTTLWTNFAKYGNPTPDSSLGVQWPEYTLSEQRYLDIGKQLKEAANPEAQEIQFWESIFDQYHPQSILH